MNSEISLEIMDIEFIQQSEASEVVKRADNLATQQLVSMAIMRALVFTPQETNEFPIADFDMKYFTEVMLNLFDKKNHSNIQAILNGQDFRWFGDEDFE
jgi:ABC-type phosphate/phosphonate transport system ATPase subunit